MKVLGIKILSLLLIAISIIQVKSELSQENVVLAINCGGDSFKDSRGILYEAVNNY